MSRKRTNKSLHGVKANSLLDIIIPVRGQFELLDKCLGALHDAAWDLPYTVICVDNASPKEEADKFYQAYPNVKVVRNRENLGFPHACNQGVKRGFSPLLFFLNSDCIMQPDSIRDMVSALDDPKIGVVGAKLLFPLTSTDPNRPAGRIQHIGLCSNIRGDFDHIFVGWSETNERTRKVRNVIAVTGAALMTRRNLFHRLNGFNEQYGLGTYEDVDYCLSALAAGFQVVVEQKAVGYHHTSATARHEKIQFPLILNRMIFQTRFAGKYPWTEYEHY